MKLICLIVILLTFFYSLFIDIIDLKSSNNKIHEKVSDIYDEEKYKKEYPLSVPVCNPELLRWVTLFNQVKNIETPDGIKVTNIYYSLISKGYNE